MASFMQNWWNKHDMDQDGKGCGLIFLLLLMGMFLMGCLFMGLVWLAAWLLF